MPKPAERPSDCRPRRPAPSRWRTIPILDAAGHRNLQVPRAHHADEASQGVGLPSWPSGDGDGFLIIKGIRDVVLALVLGILLVTGHRRALGWVLLVEALAAYGDMATVLAHHGSVATALGVHCLTATLMVVNGLLIMHETREAAAGTASLNAVLSEPYFVQWF